MSSAAAAACRVPVPVPSRSLLRFLRLQNEIALLSHGPGQNHVSFPSSSNVAGAQRAGRRAYATKSWPRRKLSMSCPYQSVGSETLDHGTRLLLSGCLSRQRQATPTIRCFGTTSVVAKVSEPDAAKAAHATSWQERLWGSAAKKGSTPLHPDDLPTHENLEHGSMFNSRRTLAAKAALEPRLRCTEVDEHGKVILVDGEFKKSELIAKVRCAHAVAPYPLVAEG